MLVKISLKKHWINYGMVIVLGWRSYGENNILSKWCIRLYMILHGKELIQVYTLAEII